MKGELPLSMSCATHACVARGGVPSRPAGQGAKHPRALVSCRVAQLLQVLPAHMAATYQEKLHSLLEKFEGDLLAKTQDAVRCATGAGGGRRRVVLARCCSLCHIATCYSD